MLLPQNIARSQRSKLVGCNSENHFGSFSEVLFDLLKLAHGEPKNLLASPSKKKKHSQHVARFLGRAIEIENFAANCWHLIE